MSPFLPPSQYWHSAHSLLLIQLVMFCSNDVACVLWQEFSYELLLKGKYTMIIADSTATDKRATCRLLVSCKIYLQLPGLIHWPIVQSKDMMAIRYVSHFTLPCPACLKWNFLTCSTSWTWASNVRRSPSQYSQTDKPLPTLILLTVFKVLLDFNLWPKVARETWHKSQLSCAAMFNCDNLHVACQNCMIRPLKPHDWKVQL